MLTKFFNWTRLFIVIGILASMLIAIPVQAGGIQSNPIHESKSFVAPPRPILLSPVKGTLVKNLTPPLKWKSNGAHHYRVQIASDIGFLNLIKDEIITKVQIESGFIYAPTVPAGKLLYWRVRGYSATDQASRWSAKWNFKTPLLRPTLVSPTNTEPLLIDRPTFTWNVSTNSKQYILQVSTLKDFSTLLVNKAVSAPDPESGITIVEYRMPTDLPQNRILYWRVRGKNAVVAGQWSVKWSFKTGNPPSVPVLVSPVNAALVKDFTPLFNWNNSSVPNAVVFKHYELQVDDNNDFSSPELQETNTVSDFTPLADLTSETKYFWRVRAVGTFNGADHLSAWSTRWSFTTAIPAPTSLTMIPGVNPLRPSFDWDDSSGTDVSGYTIQISTKTDFSVLIINSTGPNSGYSMTNDLPAGKLIYWRVRVNGTNGPSDWTTTEFTTPTP